MNNLLAKLKNIIYSLPFGLKAADAEIVGSNNIGEMNGTVINNQVNDKRVAKHLLKGEVTKEVSELRYRTYKTLKESVKYKYIGNGVSVKKESNNKSYNTIRFSQKNGLICNDVLTELQRVNKYGIEKYNVNINYLFPVRFKLQEFLTLVDVVIKDGEKAITTLHFSSIKNPQQLNSKPFVNELEKLEKIFNNNDTYALSRNDFSSSIISMDFVTLNATNEQPDVISYSFMTPELIGIKCENGEFKLSYQWENYLRKDLTEKFYDAELEKKYQNKEKKDFPATIDIKDV